MIRLIDITRTFKMGEQTVLALNQINLNITSGEYVSIMGPSGSGKSTLLNIIGLLDQPDAGRYELDGKVVTELTEVEQAQIRREKNWFCFSIVSFDSAFNRSRKHRITTDLGWCAR